MTGPIKLELWQDDVLIDTVEGSDPVAVERKLLELIVLYGDEGLVTIKGGPPEFTTAMKERLISNAPPKPHRH